MRGSMVSDGCVGRVEGGIGGGDDIVGEALGNRVDKERRGFVSIVRELREWVGNHVGYWMFSSLGSSRCSSIGTGEKDVVMALASIARLRGMNN